MLTYRKVFEDNANAERALANARRTDRRIAWSIVFAFFLVLFLASCSTTLPIAATGEVDGHKRGTATAISFLGVVLNGGDASVARAAVDGNVHFVQTVDLRTTRVLWVLKVSTTIVTGE